MQYKNRLKWIVPIVAVLLLLTVVMYGLSQPVSSKAEAMATVTVKPGMSTKDISGLLQEQGLIKSALLFRVIARIDGLDNSLQAGDYLFSKAMTTGQIVDKLARGETAYRQFTIPEGYTIDQIAALLEAKKLVSAAKFKAVAATYAPYDYMNTDAAVSYKAEGYVFPDTYRVAAGNNITEEQLINMMVRRFNDQFTPAMRKRADELGLTISQVVILASLVEREAQVAKDRPIISGVFLKRLQLNMPLQSCATIQYILGYQKAALTINDTELPSPYNTYQNTGLPPGPIANPGLASINAVLNPAVTDYLYFVADKNGAHRFSRTYDEHLAAIEEVSR